MTRPSLHAALVAAGVPVDSHESDLYALGTPEAAAIFAEYGQETRPFRSNVDGKTWFEAPFRFAPWWEARRLTCS